MGWHRRRYRRMVVNRVSGGYNRIAWVNVNRMTRLVDGNISDCTSSADRYVSRQVQWQAMNESAEILAVYRNLVNRWFRSDRNLKRLMSLNRIPTMTFLSPPNLIFKVIANNCIFLRSDTDVEHCIISWFQSRTALNINLTTKKEVLSTPAIFRSYQTTAGD